jgi:hypothetical protein
VSCTPAERHFLDVVAEHGLGPGVGECQEAWGKVVDEREATPPRCKRCGSNAPPWDAFGLNELPPDSKPGDSTALLVANPALRDPPCGAVCAFCVGLAMSHIIDMAWDLDGVPTDALMRQLARRFL